MAQRLRYAAESFAAHRHDGVAVVFLGLLLRYRFDIVADQANRTLGLDRDALVEREEYLDFVHDLFQLLVAAENDVLFLEVGGKLHGHEGVDTRRADVVVAPCGPGILAAADRAVADMDHVLDRPPDHAFRACIGATTDGHHARNRFDVRLDVAVGFAFLMGIEVFGASFRRLFRIGLQDLFDQFFVACLGFFNGEAHVMPSSSG